MKQFAFKSSIYFAAIIFLFSGCNEAPPKGQFMVDRVHPATALTIGWYLPVEALVEIVGADFTPRVVNDKNESAIMLYIVQSDEHILDGVSLGPMEAVHLVIPVEAKSNLKIGGELLDNNLVCPLTIVEQSLELGDKYKAFGFPIYSGQIELDVKKENKYMVEAKITTSNGVIEIIGMFEEDGESSELNSAIFSSKGEDKSYFYGEEEFIRISNGKGNLRTEGENIIKAMNLSGRPYFLKLDTEISWGFNFGKG